MSLKIVGLGQGSPDYLSRGAERVLRSAGRVIVQTRRHPVAKWLEKEGIAVENLDAFYETAEDFDDFAQKACAHVLEASIKDDVAYGVWDTASDETVRLLRAHYEKAKDSLEVMPSVSLASHRPSGKVRLLAASDLEGYINDARIPLLVTELDHALVAGEWKIKLLEVYPPEHPLWFYGSDASLEVTTLEALDRMGRYNHLSGFFMPALSLEDAQGYDIWDLCRILERLRAPDGCPWDAEQTHESLAKHLLEECYEALDALEGGDMDKFCDELGDVLLQVAFHAQIAKERAVFTMDDVTTAICQKLIRRHEHIFGCIRLGTSSQVLENWERIKKAEKGLKRQSQVLTDVPKAFPALMYAQKVQDKASQVGVDEKAVSDALEKVQTMCRHLNKKLTDDEARAYLGELLFAAVYAARKLGVSAELSLKAKASAFVLRFEAFEQKLQAQGTPLEHLTPQAVAEAWLSGDLKAL